MNKHQIKSKMNQFVENRSKDGDLIEISIKVFHGDNDGVDHSEEFSFKGCIQKD